jgi:hypothetical protein
VKLKIKKLLNKQKELMILEDKLKSSDKGMELSFTKVKIQRVIILLLIRRNKR